MKKIYGFLGAAALLAMVGCSKEDVSGSGPKPEAKGDFYMSVKIAPTGSSRTETPKQGVEVGKDYENTVTDAVVILAYDNNGNYEILKVFAPSISGANSYYASTFEVDRATIQGHIQDHSNQGKFEYCIFIIANPTGTMKNDLVNGVTTTIQGIFELASDTDTYWQDNKFLMSNSEITKCEVSASDVAEGKHTTPAEAFSLGTVKVQRAMSRFDIDTTTAGTVFEDFDEESQLKNIKFTFDAVALVNQATKANLFKVTSEKDESSEENKAALATEYGNYKTATGTTTFNYLSFNDEAEKNYVFSPVQSKFTNSLYTSDTADSEGKLTGTQKAFSTLFTDDNLISKITSPDNDYTHPTTTPVNGEEKYYIWRYCMENTIFDKDKQVHGNTTGVVYRAQMTGTNIPSGAEATKKIYAFNNTIYGDAVALKAALLTESEDLASVYYNGAIREYKLTHSTFDIENATDNDALSVLNDMLVQKGFSIYSPEDGKYYCYYVYYNRHNNNNKSTQMGPMEFATVRNNVYKLSVTKISRLGHPVNPGEDPDPDDPGDEDEKDHLYFSVECQILPWEVRINDIEF